jgi:glycosyltransferase involved in cell wall biosynthesis
VTGTRRLGDEVPGVVVPLRGVRVVLDARPLQEPQRAPTTAIYLDELLAAYDADPLAGESFAYILQAGQADPTERFRALEVIGRRRLPPTRLLRSGALTIDPFVLRGASIGAGWRAERGGAAGAIYHTASGAAPLASGLPLVVTLLDLAPWELAGAYQRTPAAAFGQRLRARILRDAAAVIVGSDATRRAARRLLHVHLDRIHVVPLAPRAAFRPEAPMVAAPSGAFATATATGSDLRSERRSDRERLGLAERYFVYSGRFDARQDLHSLLGALSRLATAGRPATVREEVPWPPRILLVDTSPDDRAALARAAGRDGVGDLLAYAPGLPTERLAGLVAGARAAILPVVTEATGLAAMEALAAGTPVVATAVGALPEIVGSAGILVEPGDPRRLATALGAIWTDDALHARLRSSALERSGPGRRTWADVARATRGIYAEVVLRRA